MHWTIDILKTGQADVRGPEVYWMDGWNDWETLYFYMLVLRSSDKTIIVNSGPPAGELLTAMNRKWIRYVGGERAALRVNDAERPDVALRRLGIDPAAVDGVIVTPFQIYATANLQLFPRAEYYLSRRGWADFHAPGFPTSREQRAACFPEEVLGHLGGEAWERVRLLDDEHEILPGLRTFWVGGHHRESIAVMIDTASAGRVVFTDCIFKYPNIEQGRMLGIAESIEECRIAYHRIRREADRVIAGYDPEVLQRFPNGRID